MLPETNIIRSLYIDNNERWNYHNMCYPYNSLYFIMDGDGYIKIGEKITQLEVGKVYLIPVNVIFSVWCDSKITKFFADVTAEILPGYDIFSTVKQVVSTDYGLYDTKVLVERNKSDKVKDMLYVQSEIQKVLAELIGDEYTIDNSIIEFKPILGFIENKISSQLKVSDIADKFHWNVCVLSRKFKSIFGVSPKTYIQNLLLSKIKEELIFTQKSIKEIAEDYDFCDQYYMSGFFKKYTTLSPKQYRKASISMRLDD